MHTVKTSNIEPELLNKIIAESSLALFEICVEGNTRREPFVVKAQPCIEPRTLWITSDEIIQLPENGDDMPVVLKFINRKRGNFIRAQGMATGKWNNGLFPLTEKAFSHLLQPRIKVELRQIAWVCKNSGNVEFFI